MQGLGDDILYDYLEQNGYYLVISKGSGLKMQDLDKIQVNMLQSVPRLLPLSIEERDFNLRLYYEVGNRRALRNMARSQRPGLNEFLQMLLNILGLLEDSKNYMLNERSYLLDAEFIFIGKDYSDVFLVYIPVNGFENKNSLYEQLRALVMEMGDLVVSPPGDALQILRDYFRGPKEVFSVSSFKHTVIMLMNKTGLLQASAVKYREQPNPVGPNPQPDAVKNNAVQVQPPVGQQPTPSNGPANQESNSGRKPQKKQAAPVNTSVSQPAELSERTKVITICAALFLTAFIWKSYLDYPGEGALYITLGLTIFILDLVFIIFKIWKPGAVPAQESGMVQPSPADIKETIKSEFKKGKKTKKNQPAVLPDPVQIPRPQSAPEINEQKYYQDLKDKTTLLSEPKHTGITRENDVISSEETELLVPRAYLETMRVGQTEIINITGPRFIIGRKATAVNYVEEDKGISRLHLEVLQTPDGWAVKDLESKNYSYKNGERLQPNQVYPIHDGDRIKLATIEYTFKMRSR